MNKVNSFCSIANYTFSPNSIDYSIYKPNLDYTATNANNNLGWIATTLCFFRTGHWRPHDFVHIQRMARGNRLTVHHLPELIHGESLDQIELEMIRAFLDAHELLNPDTSEQPLFTFQRDSELLPNVRSISPRLLMHRIHDVSTHPVQAALLVFVLTNDYLLCLRMLMQAHMPLLLMNEQQNSGYQQLRRWSNRSLHLDRRLQFLAQSIEQHPAFQQ